MVKESVKDFYKPKPTIPLCSNLGFRSLVKDPKEYYDALGEEEWRRLVRDPYHKLEFKITMHFLREYLPKAGRILDAGGGPGRYAIELAGLGYEIVLLDFSPVQLDIAKRKIGRRRKEIRNRIVEMVEGNIIDLSRYDDESFDSVLCLGPLSHLIEENERRTAAKELVRVLKRNAPIFVSVIGRYGVFRTVLQFLPGELTNPSHESMFTEGVHHGHEYIHETRKYHKKKVAFPDAYCFLSEELPKLFEECGVRTLRVASCEGLSAHLQRATNSLYKDRKNWERWFKIVLETCTDPSILGVGQHILYVGRKE
ncbi:MAG: class I SAM-dependent methyltransferase [Thermoplasmata archaeon]